MWPWHALKERSGWVEEYFQSLCKIAVGIRSSRSIKITQEIDLVVARQVEYGLIECNHQCAIGLKIARLELGAPQQLAFDRLLAKPVEHRFKKGSRILRRHRGNRGVGVRAGHALKN